MRIDTVFTGNLGAAATKTGQITKGHINGLLFFGTEEDANSTVTIKRSTATRTHILAANVRLQDFRHISDLEHGYGIGLGNHVEATWDRMFSLTGAPPFTVADREAIEQVHGELGFRVFYVDLGSIYLGADSQLDFTVAKAASSAAGELRCYSVSASRSPDMMHQYDISADPDQVHTMVDAIYLAHNGLGMIRLDDQSNAFTLTDGASSYADTTVQIEDGENSFLCDIVGAYAATLVFSQVGAVISQQCMVVYRRTDGLPATVALKIRGLQLATGQDRIIVRKILVDQDTLSRNTILEAQKYEARLNLFERNNPEAAKGLRHAGVIHASSQVAAAVGQVRNSRA